METKEYLIDSSSPSFSLRIMNLTEEITPVVTERHEIDNRDESKSLAVLGFFLDYEIIDGLILNIVCQSNPLVQVEYF